MGEETIETPELRSLRPAAKQNELLPQRQVLEREVRAGSERRTQCAQQSEYERHCLSGSHAAGSSSSLDDKILANDRDGRVAIAGLLRNPGASWGIHPAQMRRESEPFLPKSVRRRAVMISLWKGSNPFSHSFFASNLRG
jgi:hypothetical protein